jgi:hypothetical protein
MSNNVWVLTRSTPSSPILINSIVEDVILNRDSPAIRVAFVRLHERTFSADEGDALELYAKLRTSFLMSVRELSKDRVILEAIQLHRNDIEIRFDQLIEALASANRRPKISDMKLSTEEFDALLLKIAKGLQTSYRTIRVETNKGARSVDISRIYIPSNLRYRDTPKNASKIRAKTRMESIRSHSRNPG